MALFSRESEYDRRHDDDGEMVYGRTKVLDEGERVDGRGVADEGTVRKARKAGSLGFKRTERRGDEGAYGRR